MNLLAGLTRRILRLPFLRKHYYGIYIKVLKPLGLFRNTSLIHHYDKGLKIKLNIGDWLQQQIYFFDVFDERGLLFLEKNLKEGDVFVDVGANIGCYTLVAAKLVGPTGRVFAFEPVSYVFEHLQFNLQLNGFSQVIPERLALLDKPVSVELYIADRENLGMSSIFHHDTESGITEKADAVSLDDYAAGAGIDQINIVKIDIEGAELEALMGMEQSLNRFRPLLIVEISDEVLHTDAIRKQQTLEWLKKHRYVMKWIDTCGNLLNEPDKQSLNYFNFVFLPEENL
ncbi:MAG: FkbM family methyltransferase [Bacteroidales bacterium]|nr:FkbM family methyltransferase [Bacteroidales bacterium]